MVPPSFCGITQSEVLKDNGVRALRSSWRGKTAIRLRLNSRLLSISRKLVAFAYLIEVPVGLLSGTSGTKHKRSQILARLSSLRLDSNG